VAFSSGRWRHEDEEVTSNAVAMPMRGVVALRFIRQAEIRRNAGEKWQEHGLVFASNVGTELDSHNVRRAFRAVVTAAGLPSGDWTPREMRHSFVSLLSGSGVALEEIARLCGHSGTAVTEAVYRHQLKPVMDEGATAMDRILGRRRIVEP
jgi:integrase